MNTIDTFVRFMASIPIVKRHCRKECLTDDYPTKITIREGIPDDYEG